MTIRVLVVDDQSMVRAGFRMLLAGEKDIDVVAEATNGLEAVDKAARLHPTVVLMEGRLSRTTEAQYGFDSVIHSPSGRAGLLSDFSLVPWSCRR
jgi:DNA-binding NarL/FixJ family response regulator